MSNVINALLDSVQSKLKAVGAKWKIVMPDGTEYGELEVVKQKPVKQKKTVDAKGNPILPRGTYSKVFGEAVKNMKVGDVLRYDLSTLDLPFNPFASSLGAAIINQYGKGSAMVATNKETKIVEALRLL
jgi:hypothetical protein